MKVFFRNSKLGLIIVGFIIILGIIIFISGFFVGFPNYDIGTAFNLFAGFLFDILVILLGFCLINLFWENENNKQTKLNTISFLINEIQDLNLRIGGMISTIEKLDKTMDEVSQYNNIFVGITSLINFITMIRSILIKISAIEKIDYIRAEIIICNIYPEIFVLNDLITYDRKLTRIVEYKQALLNLEAKVSNLSEYWEDYDELKKII
jgi:hypothetical protein